MARCFHLASRRPFPASGESASRSADASSEMSASAGLNTGRNVSVQPRPPRVPAPPSAACCQLGIVTSRLPDARVDVEVDDSKASGAHANGVRFDPGADSRGSHRGDLPPTGSQGDAVAPDAVCPSLDASPWSREDERRSVGRSRTGNGFHAHRCDWRAGNDASQSAWCDGVWGRRAEPRRHKHRDRQCTSREHLSSQCAVRRRRLVASNGLSSLSCAYPLRARGPRASASQQSQGSLPRTCSTGPGARSVRCRARRPP